jgi:hypothetical protein
VTLPVVWLPEAEADLRAAKFWYDDLRSALGDQLVSAVGATVESISKIHCRFLPYTVTGAEHACFGSRMGLFLKFKSSGS